jgi:cytochrome o ubiquinol oxidase subunit 3
MRESIAIHNEHHQHIQEEIYDKTLFGFWVYVMTDCILFGSLFATYAVLHNNIWDGPSAKELFSLPFALTETLILLTSSFTCGMAKLSAQCNQKNHVVAWFVLTFVLGLAFVAMEASEFTHLVREGNSWQRSAFLSSFFTLVATHGMHISMGLLWMVVLLPKVLIKGLTPNNVRRLACLRLFWHFLDVVWIFIFTIVYLMGAL